MRYQELNLLMIFDAIMKESSITKAAEQLNMTQPAVSNAVSRMRHIWKDELFVKDGRNIQPTLKANDLWEKVRHHLEAIAGALDPDDFEPRESDRIFRVAAADSVAGLAWPQLRQDIEAEAPKVVIHTFPYSISNGEQMLNDAEVDVVIAATNLMPAIITTKFLYEVEYICVMKPTHKLAQGKLTMEKFLEADHLLVSLSGDVSGYTDVALAQEKLSRRIGMTLNGFSNATKILKSTNLICVIPSLFVEEELLAGELVGFRTPVSVPNTRISMYWHKRSEKDQGIQWLADKIAGLLESQVVSHQRVLKELALN